MNIKEEEMKISQTYGAALIATHNINSGPQAPKSALRGLLHQLFFCMEVTFTQKLLPIARES